MNINQIDFSEWNILLIVFALIAFANAAEGYKKGMVKTVISFVSLIVTCIVVVLLGNALKSYYDGEMINVVVMVLLLCVVGIVRHLLGVIFVPARLISKLPIVSWVDKLLGIVFGIFETVLILWTIYAFMMILNLGTVEQIVLDYTGKSWILSRLYQHNYLTNLIEQIGLQVSF